MIICDRCKKAISINDLKPIKINDRIYDICNSCNSKYEDYRRSIEELYVSRKKDLDIEYSKKINELDSKKEKDISSSYNDLEGK